MTLNRSYQRQDLSLFCMPKGFRGRNGLVVQLWWLVQATLFRWSPQVVYSWRAALLRLFGAKVGRGCVIRPSVTVTYPWKVVLGDHVWVGDDAVLYSLGPIKVGSNSVISQRCYICAADHDHGQIDFPIRARAVTIGSECWIAADSFVAPGISIGDRAVVGARSSVFTDLPADMVAFGNPARPRMPRVSGDAPCAPPSH